MDNRPKYNLGSDKNSPRERTEFLTPLHTVYIHYSDYISRRKNHTIHPSRFLRLKKSSESAADVWERILEIERNYELDTFTAAEFLASKFVSLIGKPKGD